MASRECWRLECHESHPSPQSGLVFLQQKNLTPGTEHEDANHRHEITGWAYCPGSLLLETLRRPGNRVADALCASATLMGHSGGAVWLHTKIPRSPGVRHPQQIKQG